MSEADYDREIAPALLELANKCREYDMSMVAVVEYGMDGRGRTQSMRENASLDMKVIARACVFGSRLDDLMIAIGRLVFYEKIPHTSIVLHQMGIDPDPSARTI
jgi:hypothetical protein